MSFIHFLQPSLFLNVLRSVHFFIGQDFTNDEVADKMRGSGDQPADRVA